MSLQPSQTFANNDRQLYALASESASKWYTFPSLTGEVLLVDASGTQVLQSVDGNLFYNEELLARAGDIQQISEWSNYPVLNPGGVDFAGNPLLNASTIEATGDISGGSLTVSGSLSGSSVTVTSAVTGGSLSVTGSIQGNTLSLSGAATVGSVSSTGAIAGTTITGSSTVQGAGLVTTAGLDMANTSITRASAVNISNAGFAPYGQLTSPNGTQLLWNGATINTGGSGDVSQWANYNAVTTINANTNPITNAGAIGCGAVTATGTVSAPNMTVGSGTSGLLIANSITSLAGASDPGMSISAYRGLTVTSDVSNIVISAGAVSGPGNISTTAVGVITNTATGSVTNVSNNFEVTADGGLNPLITPNINLTAQNGNGGQINIVSEPGSIAALGGVCNVTANGGTILIPQPPPAPPLSVTVGGELNLTASTGSGAGIYTATSAINLNAASINSYSGAIPPFGSVLGYNTMFGNLGVSICAGLPPSGIQFPGTCFLFGLGVPGVAGGVRIQSPTGIQLLSDTYIENLYPLDGNGLTIQGRSLPTGTVNIYDVTNFSMNDSASVLRTDQINSVSSNGILLNDVLRANNNIITNSLKPQQATAPGVPNLVIANNPFLTNTNYVDISGADTIAFDATGSGKLLGVQSINNAPWPPPTGDASLWSQYPATSVIDVSGYDLSGVVTINGSPYPPAVSSADWSLYPALQNVDISGFNLNQVASINVLDNATIVSAGSLGIFADTSGGNLTLSTNGGGDVNIGTGNAGDINIVTSGTGNEVTIGGDVVNLNATVGINMTNSLDMTTNNIINVTNLNGVAATTLTLNSTSDIALEAATDAYVEAIAGSANLNGNVDVNIVATTGAVNVTAPTVQINAATTVGTVGTPKDLIANGNLKATSDVVSSFGTSNYSLNTIGGLVAGTSSRFRDATEFYVSSDGSDASNNGSILAPYATIQKAITQAELISSAALVCVINVASGHYTEDLTFNRGYITLNGSLQSQTGNEVCEITGSISVAVAGASDLFNRQISFQGFNITCGAGQAVTDTATTPHIVSFQDCKVFVVNQFFVSTTSAADMRLYMTNVEIQQTNAAATLPTIITNVGQIELERVDINLSGNVSAIVVGGTSILSRFSLSALDANSTAATLLPLLSITSTTTSTHTLGNVAFAFTSAVAKTNTSAVYINSGINTAIIALNNVFTLTGTASSTNYCVGYSGVGSPTIAGINNTSLSVPVLLPQTTAVQTGITQIQYTDINPPVMGAYSKSGDQSITLANTPVAITFNTTQFQQGTALATTRLQVSASGNYQVNYQVQTQASVAAIVTTYLSKNGTALPNTGSQFTSGTGSQAQTSPQFIISLNSGDYIELYINSNSLGTIVNSTAAAAPLPAIPGAIITVTQIR